MNLDQPSAKGAKYESQGQARSGSGARRPWTGRNNCEHWKCGISSLMPSYYALSELRNGALLTPGRRAPLPLRACPGLSYFAPLALVVLL